MISTVRTILLLLFVFVVTASLTAQQTESIQLGKIREGVWQIDIECGYPTYEIVPAPLPYSRYSLADFGIYVRNGWPQIPFKKFTFALPPGSQLEVRVLNQEYSSTQEAWIPFSLATDSVLSTGVPGRVFPIEWGDTDIEIVSLSEVRKVGQVPIQSVEIFPVVPTATGVGTSILKRLSLEVELKGFSPVLDRTMIVMNEADLKVLGDIINPEHAYQQVPGGERDVGNTWNAAAQTYVKILVDRDGIYRLRKSSLDTLGVSLAGVDPRTFQLYNRGKEQPLFVEGEQDQSFDSSDFIEFYGHALKGERGEWFDFWSEENVYWLTWGADTGVRFGSESIAPGAESPRPWVLKKIHREEDAEYHAGDSDSQADISEFIAGETWIWKYLLKKDSLVIPVHVTGVDTSGGTAVLLLRIKGSSVDSSRARIAVNGTVVSEQVIQPTELRTLNIPFAGTLLREGSNTVSIVNAVIVDCPPTNPTCTIERFYVDWIDIVYRYTFTSEEGIASFSDSVGLQQFRAVLTNFSTPFLGGYNITAGKRLLNVFSQTDGQRFKVEGSFRPGDMYYLYEDTAISYPKSLIIDTPSSWSTTAHGADYIIITHSAFRKQAEQLADYREREDGFRVALVDVADIYDEFNHGIKHPSAVRQFLRHAYYNWERPAPRFVVLIGDASWDPKFNHPGSIKADYVPTWGYPANDNYFVAFDDDRDIYPKLTIGRIPCETPDAAEDVLNKIFQYESLPQEHWNKRILMINGGKEAWEHATFRIHSEYLIRTFLEPYCFDVQRIYRTSEGIISYTELDSIIRQVNNGCLWFNFVGHGGPRIIDVGVDRPELFRTLNKYPFFVTMSCNTAHFAEPAETGLNESFVLAKGNGSICSYGTAGRGVIQYDDLLSDKMFEALTTDSIRTFGELSTRAKIGLLGKTSESDQIARNIVNQYIILGDPATHIPVPLSPELSVSSSDIATMPSILTDNTVAAITVDIYNDGLCLSDSVTVEILHQFNNQEVSRRRISLPPFPVSFTMESEIDFRGKTGMNTITITVDPDARINESNRADNMVRLQKNVVPQGVQLILPLDQALIPAAAPESVNVTFIVSNPALMPVDARGELLEETRLHVQVAQDESFSRIIMTGDTLLGRVFSRISLPIPSDTTYYWRARIESGPTVDEWSTPRSFTVERGGSEGWLQTSAAQFEKNSLEGCSVTPDGSIRNSVSSVPLEVVSGGSRNVEIGNFADIRIQGINVSPNRRGFNIAVLDRQTGILRDTVVFDTYWSSSYADDMAEYLAGFDSTHLVIIAVKDDANGYPPVLPGGTNITLRLKDVLAEYGAQRIEDIRYRGSYALVGIRGVPEKVRESVDSLSVAVIRDTIGVRTIRGRIRTPVIGPVSSYRDMVKQDSVPSEGETVYSVYGIQTSIDTLLARISGVESGAALGHIPASKYPYVRLEGELGDSTGRNSPTLQSWRLHFDSNYPELGINCQSVYSENDSVLEGTSLAVYVRVVNSGRDIARDIPLHISLTDGHSSIQWMDSTVITEIPKAGEHQMVFHIPTTGRAGRHLYEITVDPYRSTVEYFRLNNIYSGSFVVQTDKERPAMEVLFDGVRIANNDYVSPKPDISVRLLDESPLAVTDTSSIQMFLDGRRVYLINNPEVSYTAPPQGNEKLRIVFSPELSNGTHSLAVNGKDASGNYVDSISYQVRFLVSGTNRIDQLFPYPNPTSGFTAFTFRCIGSSPPDEGTIKIYTVAGRLIREINIPASGLSIGFNTVEWDGRDAEGDLVGNGLYFYKLVLKRMRQEESYIDKIAVIR